jgi:DNA modification methylase
MYDIYTGDCIDGMKTLPDGCAQTCVTSPPYFGLRDYGNDGQIGLEPTPDEFVTALVAVFREVRRVLRDDGTVWLNLGDSYSGSGRGGNPEAGTKQGTNKGSQSVGVLYGLERDELEAERERINAGNAALVARGLKPKDLIGIPWRVAFALQQDGWYLRQDIIWHKPNPMPESVKDRCTKAHEYIFLLSKSANYFYDHEAIKETAVKKPQKMQADPDTVKCKSVGPHARGEEGFNHQYADSERIWAADGRRNRRSVWTVTTKPFKGAHFATFPPDLIRPCIMAGSAPGDMVIDPFTGSGTVGMVCGETGRRFWGAELNPDYAAMANERIKPAYSQGKLFDEQCAAS